MIDPLANVGIDGGQRIREGQLAIFRGAEWEARCRHLANADLEAPRGGGGDTQGTHGSPSHSQEDKIDQSHRIISSSHPTNERTQ